MKLPLVVLPQTIGPFKASWARWMGRQILRRATVVFSRDQASLNLAGEIFAGKPGHYRLSHDMAFALEPREPDGGLQLWIPEESGKPLVGLNVSGLLCMGGYTQDNMFGLRSDYRSLIRDIVRWFVHTMDAEVVLITHVLGYESDADACRAIYDELSPECDGSLHFADPGYDHREIKFLIGKCDFFLGARMHACIAALSQGIPAVGMAYSKKFLGVFETVGAEELIVDLRSLSQEEVMEKISSTYAKRDYYGAKLSERLEEARSAALGLFDRIEVGPPTA